MYPFGATLNVQKPAVPILSSGTVSYPLNRPIGAAYVNPVCLHYIFFIIIKNLIQIILRTEKENL